MKVFIALLAVILFSCGNKPDKVNYEQEGNAKVAAIYTRPDSSKILTVMLRVISKKIAKDSTTGKDKIVIDTLWGKPTYVPLLDSLGKPVLDSLKKPVINPEPQYFLIPKDSVYWRIEGKDLEQLLKNN